MTGHYEVRSNCYAFILRGDFSSGGLVGINEGIITGSYTNAATEFNVTNTKNACNYSSYNKTYSGGIVGTNSGYISDTYFNGTINSTNRVKALESYSYYRLGGIVGSLDSGVVKNSYNSGKITYSSVIEKAGDIQEELLGGAIGLSKGTLTNVYYLDSVGYSGAGTSVSANDLSNLNISLGNYYNKDSKTQNGGYPILKWQR